MAEITPTNPPLPSPLRKLPGMAPSLRRRYGARATLWLDAAQLVQESVQSYTQEIHRAG